MMFSGVYYVKTDDDTSIEFVNPNKAHEFVNFLKLLISTIHLHQTQCY